jgi:hypothetical protein
MSDLVKGAYSECFLTTEAAVKLDTLMPCR